MRGGTVGFAPGPTHRLVIRWPSASGRVYRLRLGTDLMAPGSFSDLVNDLPATPPVNTYTVEVDRADATFYLLDVKLGP